MDLETLSPLTDTDRQRLAAIWEAAVRATHHFLGEDDIDFFRPLVRDTYLDCVRLTAARDAAGQLHGFVGTAEGKVEMLFVDPACHGQGLGRRLMQHAIDVDGARAVDVNEQNPQAVGFYHHLGFQLEQRSELDGSGRPFPILHLRLPG
ncbi:GNAT family N-acetyltransferase [Metapseudomonas otitidis]|uniref:GNAT family N-acetyltransferase n=1 Tax=Metapseudomonas otitidis TaxID=319939 RepID=UPI002098617A|nr:GNAT family N-acetyltransferase [Pseudomonas otitidis]MCO7553582.1 GNAT family N-acetyltransferase [Pseudomonas otitidis]